jgi:hypothetical protein
VLALPNLKAVPRKTSQVICQVAGFGHEKKGDATRSLMSLGSSGGQLQKAKVKRQKAKCRTFLKVWSINRK